MTLEQLRTEAQRHGYKLVKERPYIRMLPCVCGHKNIGLYAKLSNDKATAPYSHKCWKCGFTSEPAKTKYQAKLKWNECVENAKKEETK